MPWLIAGAILFLALSSRAKSSTPLEQAVSERMKEKLTPEMPGVREKLRILYPDATSIAFSGRNWAVSFKRGGVPFKPDLYFDAVGEPIR